MKFKGTLIGAASGSLAGTTFSHNRGGQYTRRRAIPTNPNSPAQAAVRSYLSDLTSRWNNVLTPEQRDAWDIYAQNTPINNSLGDPVNVGGLGMYIRANVPRRVGSIAIIDDGPTIFNLSSLTKPGLTSVTASTGIAVVTYTNTDDWAGAVGGALMVYASRPQNPSINFFRGPYQFAGKVAGAGTPPTSPANITVPFALSAGQKVFFRFNAFTADGRLSAETFLVGLSV